MAENWLVNPRRCGYGKWEVAAVLVTWGGCSVVLLMGHLKLLLELNSVSLQGARYRNCSGWEMLFYCLGLFYRNSWSRLCMPVQKLVLAQPGLSRCLGGVGVELALGATGEWLLRGHLWNCPQALDLVRLSASPAEEVFPELEVLSFAPWFLNEFYRKSGFFTRWSPDEASSGAEHLLNVPFALVSS